MVESVAGRPTRVYQLSEYENSFRRPSSGSSKSGPSDVAGQTSSKMAILQEASKRGHLNRRAAWQAPSAPAATASNATPPRRRASTPPPATATPPRTRTTTPPRAATPRTTPPRRHLTVAQHENDMIKEALFNQQSNFNKDRSPRRGDSSTATPYDSIYQGSPESSEVSAPSSLRQRTDVTEDQASSRCPRRPTVTSPPARPSPRGVGSDSMEEVVRRWVAWSQDISSAVEQGSSLPPPPVPQPDAPGVSNLLLRVLEASAFAAAALARGSMEAKDLRAELSKERDKAQQDKDIIHELKRRLEELQALSEAKEYKLAEAEQSLKEAERRLRAPCIECGKAQLRLSDLADEVQSLRGELQDAEARRRKEVEDALSLADGAEAKHTQLMVVLRQVLASNGNLEGAASAAAAMDVVAPSVCSRALPAQAHSVPSRTHQGEAELARPARTHESQGEPAAASFLDRGETEPMVLSRKHRDRAEVNSPRLTTSASSSAPAHEVAPLEPKSWWRASADLRAVGVEAESDPEDPPELSEPESPEPSPVKAQPSASSARRSQTHNSSPPDNSTVPHDSPVPRNSPPMRGAPWARPSLPVAAASSSRGHRRSSEPTGQEPRPRQTRSSGEERRNSSGEEPCTRSSDAHLADATQRLELEVVELCRALGGTSPRATQPDSTRSDFDDDAESSPSPPPRRAKGSRR